MSWGVKTTCFKAPGVSLGGSGVSIGGVRSLRVRYGKIYKSGHTHLEYENVFSFRWVIDRLKPENQPFFLGISPTGCHGGLLRDPCTTHVFFCWHQGGTLLVFSAVEHVNLGMDLSFALRNAKGNGFVALILQGLL